MKCERCGKEIHGRICGLELCGDCWNIRQIKEGKMTMLPGDKKALNEAINKFYKDLGDPDSFCKGYGMANDNWKQRLDDDLKICVEHFPTGCNWGACYECGGLFLHHKLLTGEIIEEKNKVTRQAYRRWILRQHTHKGEVLISDEVTPKCSKSPNGIHVTGDPKEFMKNKDDGCCIYCHQPIW